MSDLETAIYCLVAEIRLLRDQITFSKNKDFLNEERKRVKERSKLLAAKLEDREKKGDC